MKMEWWVDRALCRHVTDPDRIFFPAKGQTAREAKAICAACPVQAQCFAWSLTLPDFGDVGVLAGTVPQERARIRRERQRGAGQLGGFKTAGQVG
jgi:WhiB family transcriptional regulator, redox-sensing transcriptional regulator